MCSADGHQQQQELLLVLLCRLQLLPAVPPGLGVAEPRRKDARLVTEKGFSMQASIIKVCFIPGR